jgi:hypothetical protein
MYKTWFDYAKPFKTVYGPEDDQNVDNNDDSVNDDQPTNDITKEKLLNKKEVEEIVKREKKKFEEKTKKTISELETLRKSKSLTEQEQSKLSDQINSLQEQLLTKEELAKKEKASITKDYETKIEELAKERDAWKIRFTSSEISRAIIDAASERNAFRPKDIQALLRPDAVLEEEKDDNGEGTGKFYPKVNFTTKGKDGKDIELKLSPKEAVKQMFDDTDQFGHLFQGTAQQGLGGDKNANRSARDLKNMSHSEYRKNRERRRNAKP